MPILPENKGKYPADWAAISVLVREDLAGQRCEGSPGFYPDCRAQNHACSIQSRAQMWS